MKMTNRKSLLWVLALIALGCASPPPVPPEQIPPPPSIYGDDPYQTGTASAAGAGAGVVASGSGANTSGTPMTEQEAINYIKNAIESRSILLAQGFDFEGEISSEKVKVGDEMRFAVTASKGRCIRLIAAADTGIPKLDMYLYDGDKLLDRDIGNDNYPVVSSCFKAEKEVTLELKVEAGSGWFVVRVYSKKNDGTVKKTMDAVEKASGAQ